jgi:plasmid stabilization system protein ParE
MPRGDKSKYTDKQKRKAEHIADSYESRGVPEYEARAWATVNKESGGGKLSGSGRGQPENYASSRKRGRLGGRASPSRPASAPKSVTFLACDVGGAVIALLGRNPSP